TRPRSSGGNPAPSARRCTHVGSRHHSWSVRSLSAQWFARSLSAQWFARSLSAQWFARSRSPWFARRRTVTGIRLLPPRLPPRALDEGGIVRVGVEVHVLHQARRGVTLRFNVRAPSA